MAPRTPASKTRRNYLAAMAIVTALGTGAITATQTELFTHLFGASAQAATVARLSTDMVSLCTKVSDHLAQPGHAVSLEKLTRMEADIREIKQDVKELLRTRVK